MQNEIQKNKLEFRPPNIKAKPLSSSRPSSANKNRKLRKSTEFLLGNTSGANLNGNRRS